jgi:hypothetical protein
MTNTVRAQIDAIRATGAVNLLDILAVFELALKVDFLELADLLFENTPKYSAFIISGQSDPQE